MDSLITAAARALAAGDLLGVLRRVALRNDPAALALRGIAMAQLGDFARAKTLLQSAARAFGSKEAVARARCVVAEAEIALVSRDLGWPAKTLAAARQMMPGYATIWTFSAALALEMNDLGAADEYLRRAESIEPSMRTVALEDQLAKKRAAATQRAE